MSVHRNPETAKIARICFFFQNKRNLHVWHAGSWPIFVRFCSGKKECFSQAVYFNISTGNFWPNYPLRVLHTRIRESYGLLSNGIEWRCFSILTLFLVDGCQMNIIFKVSTLLNNTETATVIYKYLGTAANPTIRLCRIRSDSVWFGLIWSDLVWFGWILILGKFGKFGRTLSNSVRFSRIWSDLVGFGWSNLWEGTSECLLEILSRPNL